MKSLRRLVSIASTAALLAVSMLGVTACDNRQELIIYNWGEYIAEDTIAKFEAAYPQYKVIYRTFETNETMYPNLDNTYDVIIPSEYMVCRLINEQRLQPLDMSLLPNVTANMDPMFNTMTYSQDEELSNEVLDYAIPYLYCTVGLVYDANRIDLPEGTTDPAVIWSVLFDEANAGNIGMYDSMRESIGVALNYLGYSINSMNEDELAEAMQLLIDQKTNINPTYGVDNLKDKMASGEMAASVAWSGDHIVMLDRIAEI